MTLQVGELAEGLGAAGVAALVGLVARVRPDVLLQVGQLRELALADLASERRESLRQESSSQTSLRCWECARLLAHGKSNTHFPQKSSVP